MKKISTLFFLLFSTLQFAQELQFDKQVSFINDNDLYVSIERDRYYTNGMFLSYNFVDNKETDALKVIKKWEIGHLMYTPYKAVVQFLSAHDRPFAGYLYAEYGIKKVFESSILETNYQLGILGPSAFGKDIQDFIHNIYGFVEAVGWKYQIETALGANFGINYSKSLFTNSQKLIDITWVNKGRIGTIFTDANTGLLVRIGLKEMPSITNSTAFNTNLQAKNSSNFRKKESFFYVKPSLTFALYDATLQGSFLNTSSPFTVELKNVRFSTEIGYRFTTNRWSLAYFYKYHTNKSKNLRSINGNSYGSLQFSYAF